MTPDRIVAGGFALRPPVVWRLLLLIAGCKVLFNLTATALFAYGYTTDELYFLDSIDRLAWGYVDHPPLSIVLLAGVEAVAGDSLFAIRVVPALLGGFVVFLGGALARELGGGRAAQGIAALAVLCCPVYLALTNAYTITAPELVFWGGASWLLLRILNGADARTWLALGATVGLGLLTKYTLSWFAFGLLVGLLLTPERRWLATRWPWLGAGIALLLFAPHLAWQLEHGFPTFEYFLTKSSVQLLPTTPWSFAVDQVITLNPLFAPLWAGGLAYLLAADAMRPYRCLAWIWISVVLLLMASGTARSYYAAPAYPVLFAAGARGVEQIARAHAWRGLPAAVALWLLLFGLYGAPFAMPLLPPENYGAYRRLMPFRVPKQQTDDTDAFPAHLANRLHGAAVFEAVAGAYAGLPAGDRSRVGIFTTDQGMAGAVNRWGAAAGMPRAIGNHNTYWLWGPGATSGEVMIVVWPRDEDLSWWFEDVEHVADFDCAYCLASLTRQSVYVGRDPHRPLAETWPALKNYR
jgi:4-amino-4-deoxy-L-arabinose transferase-like glycosyltransferase